jgi:solute carrier family 25 protein 16
MTIGHVAPLVSTSASQQPSAREPKICPTDDEAIVPKRDPKRKLNKQSWEYVIKSGVAGGLAGCAVWLSFAFVSITFILK